MRRASLAPRAADTRHMWNHSRLKWPFLCRFLLFLGFVCAILSVLGLVCVDSLCVWALSLTLSNFSVLGFLPGPFHSRLCLCRFLVCLGPVCAYRFFICWALWGLIPSFLGPVCLRRLLLCQGPFLSKLLMFLSFVLEGSVCSGPCLCRFLMCLGPLSVEFFCSGLAMHTRGFPESQLTGISCFLQIPEEVSAIFSWISTEFHRNQWNFNGF